MKRLVFRRRWDVWLTECLTPIETDRRHSFVNDAMGLTQVLLADDGTTTTANLFGLDLILQQEDDGNPQSENVPLYLLTDGLGSVRIEMTGGEATATTSYAPYGEVLSQSGTSHTSYGYTGEQYDQTTGLLYLRARYYNPTLHQFMAKDPFGGYPILPASLEGYQYAQNSPILYADPTGRDPHWCGEDMDCYTKYLPKGPYLPRKGNKPKESPTKTPPPTPTNIPIPTPNPTEPPTTAGFIPDIDYQNVSQYSIPSPIYVSRGE